MLLKICAAINKKRLMKREDLKKFDLRRLSSELMSFLLVWYVAGKRAKA